MRAIKLLAIGLAVYLGLVVAFESLVGIMGMAFRAVPVTGAERDQISRDYSLPFWVRLLTGFPPRSYLRLDPR